MKILHFTIIFAFELFGICHLSWFRSWLAHLADASPSRALSFHFMVWGPLMIYPHSVLSHYQRMLKDNTTECCLLEGEQNICLAWRETQGCFPTAGDLHLLSQGLLFSQALEAWAQGFGMVSSFRKVEMLLVLKPPVTFHVHAFEIWVRGLKYNLDFLNPGW